jgi:hypothetical protein
LENRPKKSRKRTILEFGFGVRKQPQQFRCGFRADLPNQLPPTMASTTAASCLVFFAVAAVLVQCSNNRRRVFPLRKVAQGEQLYSEVDAEDASVVEKFKIRKPHNKFELDFMRRFCHSKKIRGLVQLRDICEERGAVFLVYDDIPGVVLANWEPPDNHREAFDDLVIFAYELFRILIRLHKAGCTYGGDFLNGASTDGDLRVLELSEFWF